MAEIKISDLSVGDWIATESAQLVIEGNDIATAFVDKVKKPLQIVSVLGAEQLVFGRIEELDGFTTIYLKAEHIKPIPLTSEILEKNGWLPPRKAIELDTWWWTNGVDKAIEAYEYEGEWYLTIIEQKEIQYRNRVGIGLKHTHQLQHALRLTGVEKEIEV